MSIQALTADAAAPRIVKARAAAGIGTPVAFNYRDLEAACHEQLNAVEEQSQRMLADTQATAERLKQQAAEAGRKAGYQDGLKAAEAHLAERVERLTAERLAQQLETVLPAVRQLAEQLVREQDRWIARWEKDAVQLAVAIAEKLLHRTLAADPAAADAIIAETLRVAAGTPVVRVRLSPVDVERLGDHAGRLAGSVESFSAARIEADPQIAPGGCLIETQQGHIDGRLDTLLARIASELCDEVASTGASAQMPS